MLNVIQRQAFHVFGWRGVVDGVQVHQSARQIIRSERNLKTSISFFLAGERWRMGFESIDQSGQHQKLNVIKNEDFIFLAGEGWWMGFKSIDKPGWSLEVEHNTKMSISFLWLERGGGWGLSPLTSPANHQKLNVIQKVAFHFFGWRGLADGVQVHWPAQPIIRSGT